VKSLFWTAAGVAVGVMATRKASRALEQFTPEGVSGRLADSIADLGDAIRQFGMDVREAMWDREDELRDALGLNDELEPENTRGVR